MNNKDCELIGYILSTAYESESTCDLINRLIKIDPRVEEQFILFSENRLRKEKIGDLRDEKLEKKFGQDFCLKKACTAEEYRKAWQEAEAEFQGEKV